MNQDVNPVTAFIVILISVALIGFIFWARGEALKVGGPDQIQYDHQGNVFIHVADTLYKFSPIFIPLSEYDLARIGVQDLVGDFAFFSNGDILIRRGSYEPGIGESIRRFMRAPETKEPVARSQVEGLFRCNLESKECKRFGSNKLDFDSAFHLSIDLATDTVYLSDTGRHKLRKFDANGNQLAVRDTGYKFPNQNMLLGDTLLVADTNHHAIQVADTSDERFGEIIKTHAIDQHSLGRKIWTYSFAKVGDTWWVNNMGGGMSHGSVAIYDEQWRFVDKVNLPDNADPIDFAVLEERVLITDLANVRVYQLNFQGQILDEPLPSALTKKLEILSDNQRNYHNLTIAAIILFVLFLVVGFAVAIMRGASQAEPRIVLSSEERTFNINNPHIDWVAKNQRKVRALKTVVYLPLLFIPAFFAIFFIGEKEGIAANMPYAEVSVVILLLALAPIMVRKFLLMEIGVLDELLVIKNGKNYAVGKGKNIFYSDAYVVIGKLFLPLNRQNMIFDTQQVVQKVMPLLGEATYVSPGQMIHMLLKRQTPGTIAIFIIAIGAIVALAMGSNN